MSPRHLALAALLCLQCAPLCNAEPRQVSGIYPHLAMFNQEGECGTGAVVPWAGRLWVLTYGPHLPFGSSDKLYEITPTLGQIIRPESTGGTHANRFIHRESGQLAVGPYLIDEQGEVRAIPWQRMPGRLTGTARHLSDPANKLYYATMEEGLYEVDVHTLAVTTLIKDANNPRASQVEAPTPGALVSRLPGYHGKGLYNGQGRLIYSNNGEQGAQALTDPTIPSGALAEWKGSGDWQLVRRNQFTEVTGPGGLWGPTNPDSDPVWSVGWDARSLLLMVLDAGTWHSFRLPKASHSYDGAHGWNTEWPRIRDIGEADLLMTMHGSFWRFPKTFDATHSAGIAPRSNYLKVVGDFCRWQDRIVLGCDDTAKNEFLNKRQAKGPLSGPGQSQSNLWFLEPKRLDELGPALGHGAVWLSESVKAGVPSDPYLFSGYAQRGLHLWHNASEPVRFRMEVDRKGDGTWALLREVEVPAKGAIWTGFAAGETGAWIRLTASRDCREAGAVFEYRNPDRRPAGNAPLFAGLAKPADKAVIGGLLHARGGNQRTLRFTSQTAPPDSATYDLDERLTLSPVRGAGASGWMTKNLAIPAGVLQVDAASVIYTDEKGTWRLPKGDPALDQPGPLGQERVCREVCTERDLFNASGTFYELPAENAGGFAKIRPIATHNLRIKDYASFRGLLVLSGLAADAAGEHIIRSDDGKCALWVGAVDDLWQMGKPRGQGGPWKQSAVQGGVPSDPFLMNGYDRKKAVLSHTSAEPVVFRIEADPSGTGRWVRYGEFTVPAGKAFEHVFPEAFSACWVRLSTDHATTATATFIYE